MLRRHFIINTESSIPNDEIWYTSSDGNIVTPSDINALPTIDSNTYNDGKGIIKFKTDVTSIENNAFTGRNLTSIIIPNGVISIGRSAFHSCSSLTSVTIGNSVTSIGYGTFAGCSKLNSVNIPNSVESIEESAFHSCNSLTSITISNSVDSIGNKAFLYCNSLTSVTIGNSVTSIGYEAFFGCTSLTLVTYTGTTSQWNTITKGTNWNNGVPATVVNCTDGDVKI